MRKIICMAISLALMFLLAACGGSGDSAPSSNQVQEPATQPSEATTSESEEPSPSLEEIMYDVSQYAENEEMQISEDAMSVISDMYDAGTTDAYSIFEYLCLNGLCTSKSLTTDGIIVAKISFGQQRIWNNTGTFHSTPFTLCLDFIDPETGDVNNFKTFSSMETHSCSPGFYGMLGTVSISSNTSVSRRYFNSDFTKMIATLTMEDGAIHVGWIDENGQFTDVSARISHSSEFGGIISHQEPCFFDDYLYFMDFTNDDVQIKRVPVGSLSESSVEVLVDDVSWKGVGIYPYPDGTVVDSSSAMQEFSDVSMTYVANSNFFNDWISASEFVGSDDGMIYKYILSPKDTYRNLAWYDDRMALVPEIKGRTNWGAVVSPDGNRVAFLSKLTNGTDTSTSLFIVSIDGGEPTKVNTTYDLNNSNNYTSNVALFNWE